jgi:hypothetical protein
VGGLRAQHAQPPHEDRNETIDPQEGVLKLPDGKQAATEEAQKAQVAAMPKPPAGAIVKIRLGNRSCSEPIAVYIAPSCLHCGKFLLDVLIGFLGEHDGVGVDLIFLPTSAKDVFIMKLIHNTVKDECGYYVVFRMLIKEAMDVLQQIKPSAEQEELYKGSNNDPEMIQYQVLASRLGFSDEKIVRAIPDMNAEYENEVIEYYKVSAVNLANIVDTKEIVLPMIVFKGKCYKELSDIPEAELSPAPQN